MDKILAPLLILMAATFLGSCVDGPKEITPIQVEAVLSQMKGTYNGRMRVSYYHGDSIAVQNDCVAVSADSLTVGIDLSAMALTIDDPAISSRLKAVGVADVTAAYEFYMIQSGMFNFVLYPNDLVIRGDNSLQPDIRVVFASNYGGVASAVTRELMFNLSPVELWIDSKRYENFHQLVYHFEDILRKE